MADEPENLTLAHLQAIRRDQAAMLEQIQTLARQMGRLAESNIEFQRTIGDIKVTMTEMRSDIVQLEIHGLTRHNEILEILHRLDETDQTRRQMLETMELDPNALPPDDERT